VRTVPFYTFVMLISVVTRLLRLWVRKTRTYSVFIDWDPNTVRSFLMKWFIMEAWWWPCRFEICSQNLHNKIGVFDGEFILLF